jgi:hypothetical protein
VWPKMEMSDLYVDRRSTAYTAAGLSAVTGGDNLTLEVARNLGGRIGARQLVSLLGKPWYPW